MKPNLLDMVAWLETKDPQAGYNWDSKEVCAIAQYVAQLDPPLRLSYYGRGEPGYLLTEEYYTLEGLPWSGKPPRNYPNPLDGGIFATLPHTYGWALKRARQHLAAVSQNAAGMERNLNEENNQHQC